MTVLLLDWYLVHDGYDDTSQTFLEKPVFDLTKDPLIFRTSRPINEKIDLILYEGEKKNPRSWSLKWNNASMYDYSETWQFSCGRGDTVDYKQTFNVSYSEHLFWKLHEKDGNLKMNESCSSSFSGNGVDCIEMQGRIRLEVAPPKGWWIQKIPLDHHKYIINIMAYPVTHNIFNTKTFQPTFTVLFSFQYHLKTTI